MEFNYVCSMSKVETAVVRHLYELGDNDEYRVELESINWDELFADLSVDEMWEYFCSRFAVLLDKYVPTSSGCGHNSDPLWITTLVLKKIG